MNDNIEIYRQISNGPSEAGMDLKEIEAIIEGLLFTAGEPLSLSQISEVLEIDKDNTKKYWMIWL